MSPHVATGRIGQVGALRLEFPATGCRAEGPVFFVGADQPLQSVLFAIDPHGRPFGMSATLPTLRDLPRQAPARRGRIPGFARHIALLLATRYVQATNAMTKTAARRTVAELVNNGPWTYRRGAADAGALARSESRLPGEFRARPWLVVRSTRADVSDVVLVFHDALQQVSGIADRPCVLRGDAWAWCVGDVEASECFAVADLHAGVKGIN